MNNEKTNFNLFPNCMQQFNNNKIVDFVDISKCCINRCNTNYDFCINTCKNKYKNDNIIFNDCNINCEKLNKNICYDSCKLPSTELQINNTFYKCTEQYGCNSSSTFPDTKCVNNNRDNIYNCCINKCNPSIINCTKYCDFFINSPYNKIE